MDVEHEARARGANDMEIEENVDVQEEMVVDESNSVAPAQDPKVYSNNDKDKAGNDRPQDEVALDAVPHVEKTTNPERGKGHVEHDVPRCTKRNLSRSHSETSWLCKRNLYM